MTALSIFYSALSIVFSVLPFVVVFVFSLAIPVLLVLCYSRYRVGLTIIAGMFTIEALAMNVGGLHLGISLYYTDFALAFIGLTALLRLLFAADFPLRHRGWLLFCAVICVNLLIGLAAYGTSAGVQVRPYFYFIATGLYAMSFPMDARRVRLTLNTLAGVGVLLLCLTVYRWVVYYTPITSLLPEGGVYSGDGAMRVIPSNEALVLAELLVAGLFFAAAARGLRLTMWLAPLLLGAVLALQHRSVWLTLMVGVLIRFLIVRGKEASTFTQALLLAAVLAITVTPLLLSKQLDGVTQQLQSSAERALQGADTTGSRLNNWKATLSIWANAGPQALAIGKTFGEDTTRYIDDAKHGSIKISFFAHNLYVQTLYNTGLVGLGAFLMALAYVIRGLYRLNQQGVGGSQTQVLLVLVLMQCAYYVPYGTDYLQSLLFGVAMSFVATRLPRAETAPLPAGSMA